MSYRQAFSSFYARNFERRPWVTLAVTNGILGVIADGAAQSLEKVSQRQAREQAGNTVAAWPDLNSKASAASTTSASSTGAAAVGAQTDAGKGWDFARSGRFLLFNVGMAPLLAEWNRFLEFRFPLRNAATTAAGVAGTAGKVSLRALGKRLAADQILFAPIGLALFTGTMGAFERKSVQGVKDKFDEMYISALLANWQVWPLVQLVNFRYMPLKYRVPFVSTVGILWNIGLSLLSQATRPKHSNLSETQALQLSAPTDSSS